jgi:HEAT repeat protein
VDDKQLAALVAKFPTPSVADGKLAEVDKEATDQAVAGLHRGGREAVQRLVRLMTRSDDSRLRHALHALTTFVSGKDVSERRAFAEMLAAELNREQPKDVKAFIVRQLQLVGGREVAPALGQLLTDETLGDYAAQALLAIRDGAAEQFRAALPNAAGKLRLTAVQALGVLRDAGAADLLRKLVSDPDRDTRLAAGWALANIGDPGAAEALLRAADADGFERIRATDSCLLLAERLLAAGRKPEAATVYRRLRDTRTDPSERHVHEAATRGLAAAG